MVRNRTDDCRAGGPAQRITPQYPENPMAYKFELYKDKAGEFRFRFKAPNGESMFGSEGYAQKASAMSAIESIKKNAPGSSVEDQTK
jgi:uncharacterized protein YegP (UPF0339 family)